MRISLFITLALLTCSTAACDNKDPGASPTPSSPAASVATPQPSHAHSGHDHSGHDHTGHAHANAKPGSHEDWCVEHAVPESLCTRCNASLTPAFKATGDWCVEHDLPESQCLKCNPDLKIERPPKTAGK
jgi:hypothetical protein